jgi:hypothetical protein
MQIEMTIKGLMVDPIANTPIVILRDKDGQRVLPIWIGMFEANAIALQIENVAPPRPMTHDLLRNIIQDLDASVQKVVVYDLQENTYYALIYLSLRGDTVTVDARRAMRLRWRCGRGRRSSSRMRSSTTPRPSICPLKKPTPTASTSGWRAWTRTTSANTRCRCVDTVGPNP